MFLEYNLDIEAYSVWKIAHPTDQSRKYPMTVNESGVFFARQSYYTKRHAKNDYQILYTTEGCAEMEYDSMTCRLPTGSIALINCNKHHDYHTASGASKWTYYWIHVGGACLEHYFDAIYRNGFEPFLIGVDPEVLSYFETAMTQIDDHDSLAYIQLNNAVSNILTRLMQVSVALPQRPQEAMVKKTEEYIKNHFREPFSIDSLSEKMNLSKYYLIKLYKKQTGMTPYHSVILYRIHEAQRLLRASDCTVLEIALAVGFSDLSHFSKTFKKMVGTTPAKYRNRE